MEKTIHHGRNVKRFRDMLGIKQDALAYELGEDWNQKKVSALEQKETIDNPLLEQIAALLKVPVEAIKNLDDETAVNIISNTFNEGSFVNTGHTPTFNVNPVEKWIEAINKNETLYERLLQSEKEKSELLEKLLDKQK